MKKILISELLIIPAVLYASSHIRDPFIFIIFLNIALWVLFTTLLTVVFLKLFLRGKRLSAISAIFVIIIFLLIIFRSGIHIFIQAPADERLKSLPYLTWAPVQGENSQKTGVTKYNRKLSWEGVNIYNSRNLPAAYLIDMSGNVLHTWSAKINQEDSWQQIKYRGDGDLLAMVKDKLLIRLDWNSKVKWFSKMRFHHDMDVDRDEKIWVLARRDEVVFISGIPVPILNDYIVVLSPDGKIEREVSFFKLLKNEVKADRIISIYHYILSPDFIISLLKRKIKGEPVLGEEEYLFDIFHANAIEVIDQDIPGVCRKGDLLISLRNLDLIGIVDIRKEKLIWSWGKNNLSRQHHPTLLKNQNILVFDNGCQRRYSRVVEINPRTNKIEWEYKASPPERFFSEGSGSSQRLPNGNTLITESDSGYVFEITPGGEMVWEFYNPQIRKESNSRAVIYRMLRMRM
ncbi:MAG: arylsulfotransferase family protein [Candidatus Omnitrophota bacterium]|jgi:hypothetical protein